MARLNRSERLERSRGRRKRLLVAGGMVAGALAVGVVATVVSGLASAAPEQPAIADAAPLGFSADVSAAVPASGTIAVPVEVPAVTGMQLADAELLLRAAGFAVMRIPTPAGDEPSGTVLAQTPSSGERVPGDSTIELVWADPAAVSTALSGPRSASGFVVCLDPGHQARANAELEPIGPGSADSKPKVTGGARGVVTKTPEHEIVLAIALKVEQRLKARGVTVVMTRTIGAVDISNIQRAQIANEARADLFVRIHADSNTNAGVRGISTLYPAGNDWVRPIEGQSLAAASVIHARVIAATGAPDRGVVPRGDLSGFNWATVPSVLIESGFLSNPVDDHSLGDPAYQDGLADAIAEGIIAYLKG